MTTVRVIRSWDWPDLFRQTPDGTGIWNGITFTEDAVEDPDFVLVLNQPACDVTVTCVPERIWAVIQEPPSPFHRFLHKGQAGFGRVYTSEAALADAHHIAGPPLLPWHVGRTYDQLTAEAPPTKTDNLSWITSNLSFLPQHRRRMGFLERIRGAVDFDLFGRGFNFVDDKWDALAPYRYTIAYENFTSDWYFSEKVTDAFLAGTMPVYVGCARLGDFFPVDSFIRIDPAEDDVAGRLRAIIASDAAERNAAAVAKARERVLERYNFFPFMAREIESAQPEPVGFPQTIRLRARKDRNPLNRAKAFYRFRLNRHG